MNKWSVALTICCSFLQPHALAEDAIVPDNLPKADGTNAKAVKNPFKATPNKAVDSGCTLGLDLSKPAAFAKPINGSCTTGGQRKSILGMATMAADGSIVAPIESPGPMHTASILKLKPGDKDYEPFLKHIGGLKPGETKPLPVWDTPGKKK